MAKEMDWDAATERRDDAINIKAKEQNQCNQHPDAPHGFDRNASHNADRYVCECESWSPDDKAYRAGGLSIEQEPNSMLMEGYRIGLAEMREKCAQVCDEIEQDHWNLYKGRSPYTGSESGRADPHEQGVSMGAGECAAAIRAIKFEGDTGFRPVSEMKLYCSVCDKQQPVRIDNCVDVETNELYQDIACATCGLVIASGTGIDTNPVNQEPVAWMMEHVDGDVGFIKFDSKLLKLYQNDKFICTKLYTAPQLVSI